MLMSIVTFEWNIYSLLVWPKHIDFGAKFNFNSSHKCPYPTPKIDLGD